MTENPLLGIALMVGATICFSSSDVMAKYLVGSIPAVEIAWIRYTVFTLMALGPMTRHGVGMIRSRRPALQVVRGLGIVSSSLFFIMGLAHLPMAEAASVSFASPLFITILAIPLLGEVVGVRGFAGVLAGFVGVLIVVRPGTGSFHPGALLVLASSLAWAFAMIATRRMGVVDRSTTTVLWTAATGMLVLTLLLPFAHGPITLPQFGLVLVLGVVASTGQWLAVIAYRHAAASVLAPLSYGQLIWSSTLGFLVFGTAPDQWTLVGAVFIIGSGLYTVQRERLRLRAARKLAKA